MLLILTLSKKKNYIFKFEEVCCKDENCKDTIKEAWRTGDSALEKIKNVASVMQEAKHYNISSIKNRICHLERSLEILKATEPIEAMIKCTKEVAGELDDLINKELLWRQRSRAIWLKERDHNTSFFHKKANHKRSHNTIKKIKDANNFEHYEAGEINRIISSSFKEIFEASSLSGAEEVCSLIKHKVDHELSVDLVQPFTKDEIKEALNSMRPIKVPGPDGMPALFFQKY